MVERAIINGQSHLLDMVKTSQNQSRYAQTPLLYVCITCKQCSECWLSRRSTVKTEKEKRELEIYAECLRASKKSYNPQTQPISPPVQVQAEVMSDEELGALLSYIDLTEIEINSNESMI